MDYQSVWWRLFHSPNSLEWSNVLTLTKLLFSLPVSNGKVERIFSQVNLIKTTKRSSLCNQTLDNLVMIKTAGISMGDFSADNAIRLWWDEKTRRPIRGERRNEGHQTSVEDDEDPKTMQLLEDWDQWLTDCYDN